MFRAIAKFEKVSYEQFFEDFVKAFNLSDTRVLEDGTVETIDLHPIVKNVYDSIKLPKRATMGSAGYDFFVPIDLDIVPNTTVKIPTGIRCKMKRNYVLQIYPRSSLGFKYRFQPDNLVPIIDSDYYGSDNEGHIFLKMTNDSREDKTLKLKRGDAFAQGIFNKYYLAKENRVNTKRNGGFGSTNQK